MDDTGTAPKAAGTVEAEQSAPARKGEPRQHHFVPAGYLGAWADRPGRHGKLQVWKRDDEKRFACSPKDIAKERDLYRLDGPDPYAWEKQLGFIEGELLSVISEITANPRTPPTKKQADAVVMFATLQIIRHPNWRDEIQRFSAELRKKFLQVITSNPQIYERHLARVVKDRPQLAKNPPTYEYMRAATRSDDYEITMNNGYVVSQMFANVDRLANLMSTFQLGFYVVGDDEELVTSDDPVALIPARGHPEFLGVGIATADAIMMPLTPKLLFVAKPSLPHAIVAQSAVPGYASFLNRVLCQQSRQVYSRFGFDYDSTPLDQEGRDENRLMEKAREKVRELERRLRWELLFPSNERSTTRWLREAQLVALILRPKVTFDTSASRGAAP